MSNFMKIRPAVPEFHVYGESIDWANVTGAPQDCERA
jgi:hypothetical protein